MAVANTNRPGLGVYVHIPFCASRCDYCAFATWTDKSDLITDYVDACVRAVANAVTSGELDAAATIFVGGGTPSLIGAEHLAHIIGAIPRTDEAEVTVECNPESTTDEFLVCLRDAGVNRISLGVQSIHEHVLKGLGRDGSWEVAERAIDAVGRAGFSNFNVDLVYGGAGETNEDFAKTIAAVLACSPSPPHISAYALTIEPGTPLSADRSRHPDDDVLADRYAIADECFEEAGLSWYEVSNWALPGHACQHNANTWRQGDYVAIGCAAHGHRDGLRYRNIATPERYIEAVRENRDTVAAREYLDEKTRAHERLELALRTREGISVGSLQADEAIRDLIEEVDGRLVLTREGRLLYNEVALRLESDI